MKTESTCSDCGETMNDCTCEDTRPCGCLAGTSQSCPICEECGYESSSEEIAEELEYDVERERRININAGKEENSGWIEMI